jgi:hypothetical protein
MVSVTSGFYLYWGTVQYVGVSFQEVTVVGFDVCFFSFPHSVVVNMYVALRSAGKVYFSLFLFALVGSRSSIRWEQLPRCS